MEKLTDEITNKILDRYVEINSVKENIEIEKYITQKAVIGIDIYRYSKYPSLPQTSIPYPFD